jgi:amidohydrolase
MKKFCKVIILISLLILLSPLEIALSQQSKTTDAEITEIVKKITPQLIEIRRDIHMHPELGFEVERTAGIVAKYLKEFGLEVKTNVGKTGVIGILKGGKPGDVVGFRGDMDALPITEKTGLPYSSKVKITYDGIETGLMHACGHDIHTTVLLGIAQVLSKMREELPGTVVFYAQPAEEIGDGAYAMIEDGALENPSPSAVFAYHVASNFNTSQIGLCPGYALANVDSFHAVIRGKGGHGSQPHKTIDPIVVASRIVLALQTLVAREIDVAEHTVISVGSFHAGTASNIIPPDAAIRATIRTYGEEQRKLVKEKIIRTIKGICQSAGAPEPEIEYFFGIPSLYNDPELAEKMTPTVIRILGEPKLLLKAKPSMGGEDFCYFTQKKPSVMFWLGCTKEGDPYYPAHSPHFNPDEKCIPHGVKIMSAILLDYLKMRVAKK